MKFYILSMWLLAFNLNLMALEPSKESLIENITRYARGVPNCEFSYTVTYNSSKTHKYEFIFKDGCCMSKSFDEEGELITAVSYDGDKYYNYCNNHLVIGSRQTMPTFMKSIMGRNPLFNTFYVALADFTPFSPHILASTAELQKELITYDIGYNAGNNAMTINDNVKINYEAVFNEQLYPSNYKGTLRGNKFEWNLLSTSKLGNKILPTKMECNYFDKDGKISKHSYIIDMNVESFKLIGDDEKPSFKLPEVIADTIYDSDLHIQIKG